MHQPAENEGDGEEPAEHHRAGPQLGARLVAKQHGKNQRHEKGKQREEENVARHFRPMPMSKASRMTRKLRSPATIRKQLPYSYVTAVTVPAPASTMRARTQGAPAPRLAIAASPTSGSDMSNGKIRPCISSPDTNIAGSASRKTVPFCRLPIQRWPAPGTIHAARQSSTSMPGSAALARSTAVDFIAISPA